MDHHALAIVSIAGSSLDVLGALYLAYDLLGGEHGPLRALTRGVTYGVLFALGYGLPLGPVFGIACGITHGITFAFEFSRASRGEFTPGFWHDALASAIRGVGHGVGFGWYFGPLSGAAFAVLSTISQIIAYQIGIRPSANYRPTPHPRISRFAMLSALNRTVGYGLAAAAVCIWVAHRSERALSFGVTLGLTTGIVTAVSSACVPVIEWAADHIPERRMGVYGVVLILVGFALQSTQYWTALLDVPVR
ncbi:MAG TPA: hypothetical protein VML19_26715 [Verrucomicrobiae bacterium]|nr:hypothetical protein [Verrucomicrobiae bacterium]